jgi:hypothetical protein
MSVTLNASTSSGLVQTADTSGTIELQSNGTTRLTVASGGITTTGTSSISNLTATGTFGGGVITSGTAVASTSGTSINFTSIPSWVKRITVMFNGVSVSGTSSPLVQLGDSGGIENTGYLSYSTVTDTGSATTSSTAGIIIFSNTAAANIYGIMTFVLVSGNTWLASGGVSIGTSARTSTFGGNKTLSTTLDRLRITTVNGTDTFDAGSINILYEG